MNIHESRKYSLHTEIQEVINIKTLIFNGSPRKNGDTAAMIKRLTGNLNGEYKIVNTYTADISPCTDCRLCRLQPGCAIDDEMTEIYRYIENCDRIVIASPVYYTELTGSLLNVASRLQRYYSSVRFRHISPEIKPKKGVILLAGGGSGSPEKAHNTAVLLMKSMNVQKIFPLICSHNTDNIPASEDTAALTQIDSAAEFLNSVI